MVSILSIACMAVSIILCIALLVGLILVVRKKFGLQIRPLFFGVAGFIVFALVLESIMHRIVLRPDADGSIALYSQPFLYMLYACLAAGLFEETARFIAFIFIKKKQGEKNAGIQTALSYGIGHGGVEMILLVVLSMVSNIILCVMINAGLAQSPGDAAQVTAAVDTLIQTPSIMFLVGGIERIAAMAAHLSLSVLVWIAVNKRGAIWLYPSAILLHALVNAAAALYQVGVLQSAVLMETLTFAAAGLLVLPAVRAYKTTLI